jgi:type IV secretion system protein VirB4
MARYIADNAQLEELRDIADDVTEADFVPYACLTDPTTLLTKNGEVLQIIKITGFAYEAIDRGSMDLREVIRAAIRQSIPSPNYAIWLTTIRRKHDIAPSGDYPDAFSRSLHEAWTRRNEWDQRYINELFITIVRDGQTAKIASPRDFVLGMLPWRDKKNRNAYIDDSARQLTAVTDKMLAALSAFGARKLSVVKRENGVYYGEHLEFLEKLITLDDRNIPITEADLSKYLTDCEISFAYNAMEVRTHDGMRRFGSMLTVKEYKEASRSKLDELLQLPCEFIVTQCLDFVNAAYAKSRFKEQAYFLRVGEDNELAEQSELNYLLKDADNPTLAYGEQQTTLFVTGTSVRDLERAVQMVLRHLATVGIVCVREDMRLEECYWAMLPANFVFLQRLNYINVPHIGGFANIQNYPAGNSAGSKWGAPVSVFYTAAGTPYFFNFHMDEVGHALIVGPYGSGKSVLLNFLISESRKFNTRLFYLDMHGHAKPFIEAIEGAYFAPFAHEADAFAGAHAQLAPHSLPDTPSNREFLALWLTLLLQEQTRASLNDAALSTIRQAVAMLYDNSAQPRSLAVLIQSISEALPALAGDLSRWVGEGKYAMLFDHPHEAAAPRNGIIGFNLQPLSDAPALLAPVAAYLLHRMTATLNQTPTMLVLDEALLLLDNPLFSSRVSQWLEYVTAQNALAIMTTERVEQSVQYSHCRDVIARAATQIFLPDDDPCDAYSQAYALSDEECAYLEAMNAEHRHFMLKRRSETIIAELNLGGMDAYLAVLSGNANPHADMEAEGEEESSQGLDLSLMFAEVQ